MPKLKSDWEAEYRDPASDEEDERQQAHEEKLNAEIMEEIEACKRMEEDREFARREREEWNRMLDEEQDWDHDDFYDEAEYAYEHWS